MIWLPEHGIGAPRIRKYRESAIQLPVSFGVGGFFRLEAVNADSRSRWLTDWFHNHITNVGLDMMATDANRYLACQVGTGNVAPTDADTTLQTFHAGTSTKVNISETGNTSTAPYWRESYIRYDFATGSVVGNMSEVGVGPSASNGSNLFSRELIRDSNGNPTTITVASTEALRVHHRLRHYAPVADVVSTVNGTIAGSPATRTTTTRAARAGFNEWSGRSTGGSTSAVFGNVTNGALFRAYTGDIGAATGSPGGTAADATSRVAGTYSSGSYSRSLTMSWGTSAANFNIKSISFYLSSLSPFLAQFQASFDTTLNKTNLDNFTVDVKASWGRYTP